MSGAVSSVSAPAPLDWPATPATPAAKAAPGQSRPEAMVVPAMPDPHARAQAAARQLQEFLRQNGHNMEFSVDQATGVTIVRIYNSASGELVRQIPSEEIVRIAALLRADGARDSLSVRA